RICCAQPQLQHHLHVARPLHKIAAMARKSMLATALVLLPLCGLAPPTSTSPLSATASPMVAEVAPQFGGAGFYHMAFDATGRLLATTSDSGVAIWDLSTGAELRFMTQRLHALTLGRTRSTGRGMLGGERVMPAFSPDSQ